MKPGDQVKVSPFHPITGGANEWYTGTWNQMYEILQISSDGSIVELSPTPPGSSSGVVRTEWLCVPGPAKQKVQVTATTVPKQDPLRNFDKNMAAYLAGVPKLGKRCYFCGRTMSATLDAYHGHDEKLADMCVGCRPRRS